MRSVEDYLALVQQVDRTSGHAPEQRDRILRYGLVGEIGSAVAAVKKRMLAAEGIERGSAGTDEIAEELGDVLWYVFALHRLVNPTCSENLLAAGIASLRDDLQRGDDAALLFEQQIGTDNRAAFLARSAAPDADLDFATYQESAFLTARSSGSVLVQVCLAVLTQHAAELLRPSLPDYERRLNREVRDRDTTQVLGEIVWHVAALATLYGLRLEDITRHNADKLRFRRDRARRSRLHDRDAPPSEQLPRQFTIEIATVSPGRSRMYWEGEPLGDDLTDNAYDDDGYRFHDVMHIANAAHLGWSPVLRSLMHRKRKSDPLKDEVEDGARAKIVEEAVVKLIHSEGERVARARADGEPQPGYLFRDREEISFSFLKLVRTMVAGLEVARNRDWEWEDAIIGGHTLFHQLRVHQQGTVTVDLDARTMAFDPAAPSFEAVSAPVKKSRWGLWGR